MSPHPINAEELTLRLKAGEGLNLLDVREKMEFFTYNIGGVNIPLPHLNQSMQQIGYNKNDEIIVICKAGLRSETACKILAEQGFDGARNLTGGLMAMQKFKLNN